MSPVLGLKLRWLMEPLIDSNKLALFYNSSIDLLVNLLNSFFSILFANLGAKSIKMLNAFALPKMFFHQKVFYFFWVFQNVFFAFNSNVRKFINLFFSVSRLFNFLSFRLDQPKYFDPLPSLFK